jgi:hypothetical protein
LFREQQEFGDEMFEEAEDTDGSPEAVDAAFSEDAAEEGGMIELAVATAGQPNSEHKQPDAKEASAEAAQPRSGEAVAKEAVEIYGALGMFRVFELATAPAADATAESAAPGEPKTMNSSQDETASAAVDSQPDLQQAALTPDDAQDPPYHSAAAIPAVLFTAWSIRSANRREEERS